MLVGVARTREPLPVRRPGNMPNDETAMSLMLRTMLLCPGAA